MRIIVTLTLSAIIAAPVAAGQQPRYYGPKKGMFGEGYKHSVEKDGSWRIVTEYHDRDALPAIDVALYRAAELARQEGHAFVEILGGYGSSGPGASNGFVYARPSDSPAAPTNCRGKPCYTADVAQVLRALSGPSGYERGVAAPSSVDRFGRQVTVSGFGIGAVAYSRQ